MTETEIPSPFGELTGMDPYRFPLLAERLAIDATDTLRAVESGLRGLRGRLLVRRLWDVVTGGGQQLQAAIGQDLLAMQKAALEILREVMREEARTQYCMSRVLVNLHAVNRDLDAVADRVEVIDKDLKEGRRTLVAMIQGETAQLGERIAEVRRDVRREALVRRLTDLYRSGELHRGASPTVGAAMFIASVSHHFWGVDPQQRQDEVRAAVAVVGQCLSGRPLSIEDALLGAVEEASDEARTSLLFFGADRGPCMAVLGALSERRIARLVNTETNAADAIAVARANRWPDGLLARRLVRPSELAAALAWELAADDRSDVHAAAEDGRDDQTRSAGHPD